MSRAFSYFHAPRPDLEAGDAPSVGHLGQQRCAAQPRKPGAAVPHQRSPVRTACPKIRQLVSAIKTRGILADSAEHDGGADRRTDRRSHQR
jgi:hypothetical protein